MPLINKNKRVTNKTKDGEDPKTSFDPRNKRFVQAQTNNKINTKQENLQKDRVPLKEESKQ